MASLVVVPDISLSLTLCLCLSVVASLVIRRCWPLVGHLFQPAPSPDASQSSFVIDTTKRIKCIFKCVLLVHAYYINGHIRCQLHARVVRVLKHLLVIYFFPYFPCFTFTFGRDKSCLLLAVSLK